VNSPKWLLSILYFWSVRHFSEAGEDTKSSLPGPRRKVSTVTDLISHHPGSSTRWASPGEQTAWSQATPFLP
jgi:hypothetical protein